MREHSGKQMRALRHVARFYVDARPDEVCESNCRARAAKKLAPPYISASSENPATMLIRCAIQPSEKLIRTCNAVVRMAIADCVRPIKWRGTIDISEDCATTPASARHIPKSACMATAPARKDTKGTIMCPVASPTIAAT